MGGTPVDAYNLTPDEFVIMGTNRASLLSGSGTDDLREVVLTNKNLILVAEVDQGLFHGKRRMVKRCPLDQLPDDNGVPQVIVSKSGSDFLLNAMFGGEPVRLVMRGVPRMEAQHWADAISMAATGDLAGIDTNAVGRESAIGMIDQAREALGIRPKRDRAKAEVTRPQMVTTRCMGCHAPLTGRAGQVVTCPYCDTKQTL